jgi:hypothetical protein
MASDNSARGERTSQPAVASADLPLWRRKLYKLVPALDSLRTYTPTSFRKDLFAGVTVAAVAVPQAMATPASLACPCSTGSIRRS